MQPERGTVAERLEDGFANLTRTERQLANMLLENYPVAGLQPMPALARAAGVSTPSVARLVQKLGFGGFADFQAALREELQARISNPIAKLEPWAATDEAHLLGRFAEAVVANLRQTLERLDPATFDAVCALLADRERRVAIVGGRFTRVLADYMHRHLQVSRPGVTHLGGEADTWPHAMLDLAAGDVLVVFDIRRYETALLRIAEIAGERGAEIVLFTDQWGSPVSALARYRLHGRIEVPSAWDSSAVLMVLVEAVVAGVQARDWPATAPRIEELETLFEKTRTFRKFT